MHDEFRALAECFRGAIRVSSFSPEEGLKLFNAACIDAARTMRRAVDAGLIALPVYRQEILPTPNDTPSKLIGVPFPWPQAPANLPPWKALEFEDSAYRILWPSIVSNLCGQYPELPQDAEATICLSDFDGGQVRTTDANDWPLRAENYAVVCDWIARLLTSDEWDIPRSPSEWAKQFGISLSTFNRRIAENKIRVDIITTKSVRVHRDDVKRLTAK